MQAFGDLPNKSAFFHELWHLAIPVSLQSLLVASLSMADVMMVGSLGDTAVAAVGLATKLHFVTMVLIFGLSNAANVLIAQYVGAHQHHKIKTTIVLALTTGALLLFPTTLIFGIQPELWLSSISRDPEVVSLAARYLVITAGIILSTMVVSVYETALRTIGQTTLPLILAALSIFINIILNYLLIFGKLGLPELGVAGAAWATLFSRIFQLILLAVYLYGANHHLRLSRSDTKGLDKIEPWLSFWQFSLPIISNFVLWGIGSFVYHFIASRMSTDALAVMSILSPIESIAISTFIGFSTAASILLGRALGSEKYDHAWELKKFFVRHAIILGLLVGLFLWLAKPLILAPFGQLETSTSQVLNQTYFFLCILIWIKVHNLMAMVSVLRAGGDTLVCLKIDFFCMWVLGIPITTCMAYFFQLPFLFIYLAMFLEEVSKLIISEWRMNQKQWIRNLTSTIAGPTETDAA